MEMPKPTQAHKEIERLVGNWVGEELLHPSPWDPKGGPAIGRAQNRLALDGFAVIHDYEQERGGQITFRGHAVIRYDGKEQCYVMHWFDSMGMAPNDFKGQFRGGILELSCRDPHGVSRATFDLEHEGRYAFRMDVSPDGSHWETFMEGNYTRRG